LTDSQAIYELARREWLINVVDDRRTVAGELK